jgi:putative copper export protein
MEHSALHAFELLGQVLVLGGVFLVLGLLRPALRALKPDGGNEEFARKFTASAARWIFFGALLAGVATFLNIFIDVGEVQGKTIYAGVDLGVAARFATLTSVGKRTVIRVVILLFIALVARMRWNAKWWLVGVLALASSILTSIVSHAGAQPVDRLYAMAAQVIHVSAVAAWMGILFQLLAARSLIEGPPGQSGVSLLAEIIRRFSPVALTVVSLIGLSGLFLIFRFLGATGAVLTSAYGLTLIVKLLLLVPALVAGTINYRVIRPQLDSIAQSGTENNADKKSLLLRFGRMLELEATAGVLVIVVAGILASVSPPGDAGAYRLTGAQARAMLHPRFPTVTIANPATFYDDPERSLDDFRYSEFTHHWSGVMVTLLGFGWLLQSVGNNTGKWAGRSWPWLLVPFAIFVAAAADPEVWILRRLTISQVLGDPQIFEHQLGAVMLLVLVWLGLRDLRRPEATRPLGYALPAIFILGGILLLGHAHSTLNITEEVTNLINVQHAVFGAFILLAGAVRWLSLRGLFPRAIAGFVWPSMIIGLGLFMTFFYRETI